MTMKYDNEELIDLDAPVKKPAVSAGLISPPDSESTSVLAHIPPTSQESAKTAIFGFFAGLAITVIPALIAVGIMSDNGISNIWQKGGLIVLIGAAIGAAVQSILFDYSCRKGFLRIDNEELTFWTWTGVKTIHLSRIFGAGPEAAMFGEVFRICALTDDVRGFTSFTPRFSRYGAVSGPARSIGGNVEEGHELVRKVIIHHIDKRRDQGIPAAKLPPYNFTSVAAHKQYLIAGEVISDASFKCDGKTLIYENKENRYEIPVTSVQKTTIIEHRSKYGRTAYKVKLELDPGSGLFLPIMDILHMSFPEEIDRYCRCLPTLLPRHSRIWSSSEPHETSDAPYDQF